MVQLELSLVALAGLVVLSAFFNGVEVALVAISKTKLRHLINQNRRGSGSLAKLKSNPRRMLITIIIGNNVTNVTAAAVAADVATGILGNTGLGISIGIMTLLLLVFGEITPKTYSIHHSERISLRFARVILGMQYALYPFVRVLEIITTGIFKASRSEVKERPFSEAELRAALDIGVEEKVIEKHEREMIGDVLEFHDTTVEAIMTPRNRMLYLDTEMTVQDAVPLLKDIRFSRIPLTDGPEYKVTGIVLVRDVMQTEAKSGTVKLKDLARKPILVPKNARISSMLGVFQRRHAHMAIVVDEHGRTAGIVTLEDVLEELVGEIEDEKDVEDLHIRKIGKHTLQVDGEAEIDEVNEALNVSLPKSVEYSTIGGMLNDMLGRTLGKGDKITVGNVVITVDDETRNVPLQITIRKVDL